jgi:dCTP deaminase
MRAGLFPSQEILKLITNEHIVGDELESLVQPNSIDLPLGARCWRLKSIRLPRSTETVLDVVHELMIDELDLDKGAVFERHAVYIAELDIELKLPSGVRGQCDSKSSTGRIDMQTRLLTDNNERYDHIPPGYHGKLYLFISSNSFLVRARQGLALNQAWFFSGNPILSDLEAVKLIADNELIYVNGKPVNETELEAHNGVFMRLDLKQSLAGYRAKFTNEVVDLSRLDNPLEKFWEPLTGGGNSITLERDQFYILSTLEHMRFPPTHTGWIPPFRPEFGEFRSHYAGFYDAGFGYGNGELRGATTTLEVRSHDNSLTLLHGTPVAPVLIVKLLEPSQRVYSVDVKSNYQSQSGPKLAKYFS